MNANEHGSLPCAEVRAQLAMLLYGELGFDQEERVESHLEACAECRAGLERERSLHAAFDAVHIEPSPSLLLECRSDLQARLMDEPDRLAHAHEGWWERFVDLLTLRPAAVKYSAGK